MASPACPIALPWPRRLRHSSSACAVVLRSVPPCSISTCSIFRWSMTPAATPPGTPCCGRLPAPWSGMPRPGISWPGSATTSLRCCCGMPTPTPPPGWRSRYSASLPISPFPGGSGASRSASVWDANSSTAQRNPISTCWSRRRRIAARPRSRVATACIVPPAAAGTHAVTDSRCGFRASARPWRNTASGSSCSPSWPWARRQRVPRAIAKRWCA